MRNIHISDITYFQISLCFMIIVFLQRSRYFQSLVGWNSEMVHMNIMIQKFLLIVDDLSKVGYRLSFGTMNVDIIEVKTYYFASKLISCRWLEKKSTDPFIAYFQPFIFASLPCWSRNIFITFSLLQSSQHKPKQIANISFCCWLPMWK